MNFKALWDHTYQIIFFLIFTSKVIITLIKLVFLFLKKARKIFKNMSNHFTQRTYWNMLYYLENGVCKRVPFTVLLYVRMFTTTLIQTSQGSVIDHSNIIIPGRNLHFKIYQRLNECWTMGFQCRLSYYELRHYVVQ